MPLLLVVHHAEPVLQLALALLSLDPHCGRVAPAVIKLGDLKLEQLFHSELPILQGAAALFDVVDFLPGEACWGQRLYQLPVGTLTWFYLG